MGWREQSDENLRTAIQALDTYTDAGQEAIVAEAICRGLLDGSASSLAVDQVRRRLDGIQEPPSISTVDVSRLAVLRGRMRWIPRVTIGFAGFGLVVGTATVSAGELYGYIYVIGAGAVVLFALLKRLHDRIVTSATIAVLVPVTLVYSVLAIGDVLTFGRMLGGNAIVAAFLGFANITCLRARVRYQRLAVTLMPNQETPRAVQSTLFQSWSPEASALFACATTSCVVGIVCLLAAYIATREYTGYLEFPLLNAWQATAINTLGWILLVGLTPALFGRARVAGVLTSDRLRADDPRSSVLFLRAFSDDGRQFTPRWLRIIWVVFPLARFFTIALTVEELIVKAASVYGPVFAIGAPDAAMKQLGAARDLVPGPDWKEPVVARMRTAAAVIAILGDTPGILWEYAMLHELGLLNRLVLLIPAGAESETLNRVDAARASLPALDKVPFRMLADDAVAVLFPGGAPPEVIVSRSRTASDYHEAIRVAVQKVMAGTRGGA